jgi:putative flippase GtrA
VKTSRELLGAGMGGVIATGIDLALLVLMIGHHVSLPVATFAATLAGAATSFVISKYVAFRDRAPLTLGQVARFDGVAAVAALVMAVAVKLVTAHLGVSVIVAKLACAAVVFALWTYPAQRRFVFPRGAEAA